MGYETRCPLRSEMKSVPNKSAGRFSPRVMGITIPKGRPISRRKPGEETRFDAFLVVTKSTDRLCSSIRGPLGMGRFSPAAFRLAVPGPLTGSVRPPTPGTPIGFAFPRENSGSSDTFGCQGY